MTGSNSGDTTAQQAASHTSATTHADSADHSSHTAEIRQLFSIRQPIVSEDTFHLHNQVPHAV